MIIVSVWVLGFCFLFCLITLCILHNHMFLRTEETMRVRNEKAKNCVWSYNMTPGRNHKRKTPQECIFYWVICVDSSFLLRRTLTYGNAYIPLFRLTVAMMIIIIDREVYQCLSYYYTEIKYFFSVYVQLKCVWNFFHRLKIQNKTIVCILFTWILSTLNASVFQGSGNDARWLVFTCLCLE